MDRHDGPAAPALALRKASLLSELIDEDLGYFAARTGHRDLEAGAVLFSPGSKADRFWIVEGGDIEIHREGTLIARFGPGDVIGDFDFARGARRDAEARSEGGASLLVFPREGLDLSDLVRERPDASARLLLRSIAMISSRLRSVQRLISENSPWVRELKRQSWTDASTGLFTHSYLVEEAMKVLEEPTLFLLLKPDRFKELCDSHGHSAGDAAMGAIAGILREETRRLGRGWPVRIKSNETALVVPRCGGEEAVSIARSIAQAFGRIEMSLATGASACRDFHFTASQALAFWPEHDRDARRLLDGVYGVLMRAWRDGGDRVYRMRAPTGATTACARASGGLPSGEEDRRRGPAAGEGS